MFLLRVLDYSCNITTQALVVHYADFDRHVIGSSYDFDNGGSRDAQRASISSRPVPEIYISYISDTCIVTLCVIPYLSDYPLAAMLTLSYRFITISLNVNFP